MLLKLKQSLWPDPGITLPFFAPTGLRGLQVYRLHREERPNYRLRCLQWLKTQPEWPAWGWPRVSCPCSWQQGLRDLRFQPTSTGNTSFLSLRTSLLSPTSSPTIPVLTPDLSLLGHPQPLPETSHSVPATTPRPRRHMDLSLSGLVAGWWGLGSRQLCSFSSWRGGLCCSYGPWGELLTGWPVRTPWQFGMCVHRDLNPTFPGALHSSLSEISPGLQAKQWDWQIETSHSLPATALL